MGSIADLARDAQRLESGKRYAEAAAIWERLHDVERAVAAYKQGGHVDRAALLLERAGRHSDAAAFYLAAGQYAHAASLYANGRAYGQAARAYLRANQREQAALMFERAEAYEDAAKVYAAIGNVERAMQLYEHVGRADLAKELAAKHGVGAKEAAPSDPLAIAEAMLRGEVLMDVAYVTAVVLRLVAAGRLPEAAKLYSHCREDLGYPLITAASGKRDLEAQLARMFVAAKDFHKAAEVLEALGAFEQAAQLYERCGDYGSAAEVYARGGLRESAAGMFERMGQHRQAAELYLEVDQRERAAANFERALDHSRAGRLYFELGRHQQALQLLQRVQPGEHDYFESARMVAEVLARGGHRQLAIKRYVQVLRGAALDDAVAPLYVHLGELLHQEGRAAQAKTIYERVLAWRFDYGDVQARLRALGTGAAAPTEPLEPALAAESDDAKTAQAPLVSIMDGFEVIKDTPLFRELSLDEIRAFYDLAERRAYGPGEVLIEQDQPGQGLFVVRSGAVRVLRLSSSGTAELARLGAGSPIGEMSLLDAAPTSARVVSDGDVEAFFLSRGRFDELVRTSDQLALKIYRVFITILSERLRKATQK